MDLSKSLNYSRGEKLRFSDFGAVGSASDCSFSRGATVFFGGTVAPRLA